ncbi:MAG: 1-(5-phosphoribosyl)-5-[(5-phosphoribosylamino)methylideneamino]imidazole-4-carboxamide isomerase [Bacteroidales bacterium]|jgi:phosphoribosylformimino-5-aminoimidazole carboxamide ribotide isomerase|nr:1-(5-phosphoribosyl)-5-[(5-phosphoribosylamino)methylideneamino]imidazole-4-carboxamide isomerase [Bacteroidales bacterium]
MRIIIAIDIIDGQCVRLNKGNFDTKKIYYNDPVSVAQMIEDNGLQYLHLVDLDGARESKVRNLKTLEAIANKTQLTIDYGGGLRSADDFRDVFNAGATQATAGSVAVKDPDMFMKILNEHGNEKIILGADFSDGKIAISGWLENSDRDIKAFIADYAARGVKYAICTDVSKDGMLEGPSTAIYTEILSEISINLIASGGISSMEDIETICQTGCEGVITGKAFYEGKIKLNELNKL